MQGRAADVFIFVLALMLGSIVGAGKGGGCVQTNSSSRVKAATIDSLELTTKHRRVQTDIKVEAPALPWHRMPAALFLNQCFITMNYKAAVTKGPVDTLPKATRQFYLKNAR